MIGKRISSSVWKGLKEGKGSVLGKDGGMRQERVVVTRLKCIMTL